MSILDRLQLLLRSNVSSWRDRSDPVRTMDRTMAEARTELARLRRDTLRLHQVYEKALDDVARAEAAAVDALRQGDEPGARLHLRTKLRAERRAEHVRRELDDQQRSGADLRAAIEALEYRIDAARERRGQAPRIAAMPDDAPTRSTRRPLTGRSHADDPSLLGDVAFDLEDDAFARFDEMEARIADLEAEVSADRLLGDVDRDLDAPTSLEHRAPSARVSAYGDDRDMDDAELDDELRSIEARRGLRELKARAGDDEGGERADESGDSGLEGEAGFLSALRRHMEGKPPNGRKDDGPDGNPDETR